MVMLTYFIFRIAMAAIRLAQWLLIIRALMSWFPQIQQTRLYDFVYTCTEPLIQPFRSLLSRVSALRNSPLDFSVLLAFLVLWLAESLLQAVYF